MRRLAFLAPIHIQGEWFHIYTSDADTLYKRVTTISYVWWSPSHVCLVMLDTLITSFSLCVIRVFLLFIDNNILMLVLMHT